MHVERLVMPVVERLVMPVVERLVMPVDLKFGHKSLVPSIFFCNIKACVEWVSSNSLIKSEFALNVMFQLWWVLFCFSEETSRSVTGRVLKVPWKIFL